MVNIGSVHSAVPSQSLITPGMTFMYAPRLHAAHPNQISCLHLLPRRGIVHLSFKGFVPRRAESWPDDALFVLGLVSDSRS